MEILAIIIGVAGLVWGAVVLRRGGLLAGCLAVLLAGACFSVSFFKLPLGPIPLTADRLLLVLLVGQYLLWRRCGWADPKPLGKPEVLLCLFTALMTLSTFSADYTREKYQPLSYLIIYYLMPFALYWIARQQKFTERTATGLFVGLTAFGGYLALTAWAEYFEVWPLVFPRYIAETASLPGAEFVGRARGPFLNPIANGIALSICFGAALMLWPRLKRPGRCLMLPLYALFCTALYFCLTRSVWLSGALTLALAVGLALPRKWRLSLAVGGLLVAGAALFVQWDQLRSFKRDRDFSADETAKSVELRPVLAMIAWQMFLDHPLFGCGYAQYAGEHVYYLADRSSGLVLERGRGYIQHNIVLSLLAETGLAGLALFMAIAGLWGLDAWRLWQSQTVPLEKRQVGLLLLIALAAYFANGMFHEVSIVPMANMTLFFIAGAARD